LTPTGYKSNDNEFSSVVDDKMGSRQDWTDTPYRVECSYSQNVTLTVADEKGV